jgi:outer membrane protein assembly factor BamB
VIDAATNAPAPNIVIHVNDLTVTTDSNGNYDALDLVNGTYRVSLVLPVGRSDAPQPVDVQLAAGATVFQHLRFGSVPPPTPATAPAQPTVLPATGDGSPFPTLVLLLAGLLVLMGVGLRLRPPTNE